ncbi:hypothetical protein SBA4_5150011 [Candidatus Sulfopaludibacter sp. SbA4]|nr:hypothetical protein SBA4_5150011 [Candidatus Sulfopaludibacter sp. SbA4]
MRSGARYGRVYATLKAAYGLDSAELSGFLDIHFEIGKIAEVLEERFQQALSPHLLSAPLTFGASKTHYFMERMSEADEYLLSLVLPL